MLGRGPNERLNQLRPPPRVKPTTLGSGLLPARAMSPVGSTRGEQGAPLHACADAGDAALGVDVELLERAGAEQDGAREGVVAPWPTGWAETLSPWRAAQVTAATTSSASRTEDDRGRVLVAR